MSDVKQPELRAYDKNGNVRPADDRFLTKAQVKKQEGYVEKVDQAEAKAAADVEAPKEDPYKETLADVLNPPKVGDSK